MRATAISKIAGSGLATFSVPETTTSSSSPRKSNFAGACGQNSSGQLVSPHIGTPAALSSRTMSTVPGISPTSECAKLAR